MERALVDSKVIRFVCKCGISGQRRLSDPNSKQNTAFHCPVCGHKVPKEDCEIVPGSVNITRHHDTSAKPKAQKLAAATPVLEPSRNSERRRRYGPKRKQTTKRVRQRTGSRDALSRRRKAS